MKCVSFMLSGTKYTSPDDCAKVLAIFLKDLPEVDYKCLSCGDVREPRNTLWLRPSGVSAMVELEGDEQELYEFVPRFKVAPQTEEGSAQLYRSMLEIVRPCNAQSANAHSTD